MAPKPAATTAAPTPAAPATTVGPTSPAKPAAAAPLAGTAAPAAAKPDQRIGRQLIGELEGPEVITDPSKHPKAFAEAPMLADLVKAGKLPPVKDRLPEEPLVIKPVHEIGRYGGAWRRGFTGPGDWVNGVRVAGVDRFLFFDYSMNKVVPNLAKGWEVTDGGRTITVFMRKGARWSDGEPFTADDVMFWWEDIYQNKDLVPTPTAIMSINGKPGAVEKVDVYTFRFRFPEPYYLFTEVLAGWTTIGGGHSSRGMDGMGAFAPAHYMKQFYPKYTSREDLDRVVQNAGMDNWVKLFKAKSTWHLNPDLPVMTPWKTTSPANTPQWVLERNPYSVWVDTDGNQLPYIDKIVMTLAENNEILNLRAAAGEYDLQSRNIDLGKLPVLLENQQKGGYKVYLDPGDYGSDMVIKLNLSYEEDPEIAKWLLTTDFRRALSLGIDRNSLNETFWLGTGTPSSVVPADDNKYNPGPEYRALWSTYDPQKANQMLDGLGLDKKDAEGFRLRTDGTGRLTLEFMTIAGFSMPYTQIGEVIREQWKRIGIDLFVKEVERSFGVTRVSSNQTQLTAAATDGSDHLFTFPPNIIPYDVVSPATQGPLIAKWFHSGGGEGKEPPPRLREVMELWRKAQGVPEEEQIKIGKEIFRICAEDVFMIGVVGLAAAFNGVRVANVKLGNVPARQYNGPDALTPAISRPMTFYYKA